MRGLNARFAAYGGVALNSQTMRVMFASGSIAGWSARPSCSARNFAFRTAR